MTLCQRRFFAWSVLAAFAVLGAGWLLRLDFAQKISTDVLDLIPGDERAPELALVRALASEAEARAMFFVLTERNGSALPAELAGRFAEALRQSGAFDQAHALADPAPRDALGRALLEQRFTLLFPLWLREREGAFARTGAEPERFAEWLANEAATTLGVFLTLPAAIGFQDLIPADPLLLLAAATDRLQGGLALAPAAAEGNSPALVWARLSASPLSEAGQEPAFAAIERAAAVARAEAPGLEVTYSGVNRLAAASRTRIQREVAWLNGLSLVAVLALAGVFIRGAHRTLNLVPVIALAMLGAWVAVTAAFDRLHVLVFVIGSLLVGVAIDYGFHLYMHPPAHAAEHYWARVHRILKPLLVSCFTTVAGFALLLFSELPLLRQLGVFVGVGLLCALGAAVLYISTLANPLLETRTFRGIRQPSPELRQRGRYLMAALWVVALAGLGRVTWKDDIRELEIPSPELRVDDARIRSLFGEQPGRTLYLTRGATIAGARDSLEKFDDWLNTAGAGRGWSANFGAIVPTASAHARAVRFVRERPEFPDRLRVALGSAGFDAAEFTAFFEAYAQHAATARGEDLEAAVRTLGATLTGPPALLLHLGEGLNWFVTIAVDAPAASPPAETHTVSAGQLQSLNRVFAGYRESALWLSWAGLGIVGLGVVLSYGLRDGLRIFAIPCGVCLGIFGVFGWLGWPLNLFHLLGAFLGVCLTHDYSIFAASARYRREPPPASVRLSALTTMTSFSVLATSGIPVVRALGITVALMVLGAWIAIELEPVNPVAKKA
jgi:predicted exporter